MQETPLFKQLVLAEAHIRFPIKKVFTQFSDKLLQGIAITALEAVIVSLIFLFMPTYLATFFHFSLANLLILNTVGILIFSFPVILSGYLSDQIGRKKIILIGIIFFIVCTYPLFSLFERQNFMLVALVITLCGLFGSCVAGVFPCMTSELFATNVRYSGTALVYNLGFGIVGGLTPLIVTSLIHLTNNNLAPAWYLSGIAVVALIALFFIRETYQAPLHTL
jgi:MHS family proline/betaine transporter-like MFS transporter